MNTCRTASKQTTLSIFRMNTYGKPRGTPSDYISHSWLCSSRFAKARNS
jgi:hypothetical protein